MRSAGDVLLDLEEPAIGGFGRGEEEDGAFGEVEAEGGVGDAVVGEEGEAARSGRE